MTDAAGQDAALPGTEHTTHRLRRLAAGSFGFRLVLLGVLCALAQLPLWTIEDLVHERMNGRDWAVSEVEQGWGGPRRFYLPYLDLPVSVTRTAEDGGRTTTSDHIGIIAERAHIDLHLEPELRRRGLFDVALYRSGFHVDGSFAVPYASEIAAAFGVPPADVAVDWQGARLVFDVDAPQALENEVLITLDDATRTMTAQRDADGLRPPAASARLFAPVSVRSGAPLRFGLAMTARGSGETMIVPGAEQVEVEMSSPWASPSFLGARLPVQREVGEQGFVARWNQTNSALSFATWSTRISPSSAGSSLAFGVRLIQPVDSYRMVERAVKYGMLFVLTTFFVYVMFEATGGVAVHVVHYGLVALALCLFYLLLLSLAEIWGFGPAYLASCLAVLVQTGMFTRAIAGGWRRMAMFVGVLGACYGWLYILLDMQGFALLGGALGLFVLLSVAMYVLRRLGRTPSPAAV